MKKRPEPVDWLAGNAVNYHELHLRKDEDYHSDAVVKREILQGIDKNKILFVVEERDRVLEMWRARDGSVYSQHREIFNKKFHSRRNL